MLLPGVWSIDDEQTAVVEFGELSLADIFGHVGEIVGQFGYCSHDGGFSWFVKYK